MLNFLIGSACVIYILNTLEISWRRVSEEENK